LSEGCQDEGDFPVVCGVGIDYDYNGYWFFFHTTAATHNMDPQNSIKDDVYEWVFDNFCGVAGGCEFMNDNSDYGILWQNGWNRHPSDTFLMNFDSIPLTIYDLFWCAGTCFNTDTNSASYGYDGVSDYEPVVSQRDYNIGQVDGGQLFIF